ncbi:hypothetical protein FB639_002018 [Coemansia asiatica]|nr:hypothetical protein FB639_002018 [Coemansia asiatica]
MDSQTADSTYSIDRPATIACTTETASVVPLSDIADWSEYQGAGPWNAYGLRRMRSWMTAAVSNGRMPTLPSWLGIEAIGSYIAPRTRLKRKSCNSNNSNISSSNISKSTGDCCEFDGQLLEGYLAAYDPTLQPTKKCCHAESIVYEEKTSMLVVREAAPSIKQRKQLMSVFQVPEYMVEDYIWDCYRPLCFSYKECLQSWGYVHSELGNILTHACGALVFIVLALTTGPVIIPLLTNDQPHRSTPAKATDYVIIYVYILAVLFCLLASVAFHTLSCHSSRVHFSSLRCDFIGILTLIVGSFIPVGYYGFLHSYKILAGYMAMFVGIGVLGVAASILGKVEDPRRAAWRPVIFVAIAGSGLVPVIHGSILNGYQGAVDCISLWYVIAMSLLYIAGTALYAFKIPERYRPGKHNVFMQSHQIFHTGLDG